MSLQFVLGAGKTGKTDYIYQQMIADSMEHPQKNYFFLVPDQSTLNAQRELVTKHPNHGTMNIDVVGFYRLAYRIFEELSYQPKALLGDVGKAMMIRKVMAKHKNELGVFAQSIRKPGFINEVKSFFAEMYQYEVTKEDLERIVADEQLEPGLSLKLRDLLLVLEKFEEEIESDYLVSEQLLDALASKMTESSLLRNATFYLDGFTGFTPIQRKVLEKMMVMGEKVVISFTVDVDEFHLPYKEYELFGMPKHEIMMLQDMAKELGIQVESPVLFQKKQMASKELYHLERNIFRYPYKKYQEELQDIQIYKLTNPKRESQFIANEIESLVRKYDYSYKDIVILLGDMELYQNELEQSLSKLKIPFFMDSNRKLKNNPCVETILAALKMIQNDFSYDMVFRYLKSGFSQLKLEEIDRLENFILARGIRGYNRWNRAFVSKKLEEEELEQLNQYREIFMEEIKPLKTGLKKKKATVIDKLTCLYEFFTRLHLQEQIEEQKELFVQAGDLALAKTYDQVYGQVIDLLDQMAEILGDQVLSFDDFCAVLETGLEEIKIGVIPPSLDQVMIGDVERTRVDHVKVLFFVGVNEGIIPKAISSGGVISDNQRETLENSGISLAPSNRKTTYIDQYYLYLALAKPEERLYLTYSIMNATGESKSPSYLLNRMETLFPKIKVNDKTKETIKIAYTMEEALDQLIEQMQHLEEDTSIESLQVLYHGLKEIYPLGQYFDAYFYQNQEKNLDEAVAKLLYGEYFQSSVTRMEKFSGCAFAHFLTYGLQLRERLIHKILPADIGSILHKTLELVGKQSDWNWKDDEERNQFVETMVTEAVEEEQVEILSETARNHYTLNRILRMAKRVVWAVEQQIKRGEFTPKDYEYAFSNQSHIEATKVSLDNGTTMYFRGVVDRVDTYEDAENLYLKIVDYKSGNTKFDFTKILNGLQLQLIVYMNAMLELHEKKQEKRVIPGGMYYFHMDDPIIETEEDGMDVEVALLKRLGLNGVSNSDYGVIDKLEHEDEHGRITITAPVNKDGTFSKRAMVMSDTEFRKIGTYVNQKIKELGNRMIHGDISIRPYSYGAMESSCNYCEFRNVCAFDFRKDSMRNLKKIDLANAMQMLHDGGEA